MVRGGVGQKGISWPAAQCDVGKWLHVFHVCMTCLSSRTCSHPYKKRCHVIKGSGLEARRVGLKGILLFEYVYDKAYLGSFRGSWFSKQTWRKREICSIPHSNPPHPQAVVSMVTAAATFCKSSCGTTQSLIWHGSLTKDIYHFWMNAVPHPDSITAMCMQRSQFMTNSWICVCSFHDVMLWVCCWWWSISKDTNSL